MGMTSEINRLNDYAARQDQIIEQKKRENAEEKEYNNSIIDQREEDINNAYDEACNKGDANREASRERAANVFEDAKIDNELADLNDMNLIQDIAERVRYDATETHNAIMDGTAKFVDGVYNVGERIDNTLQDVGEFFVEGTTATASKIEHAAQEVKEDVSNAVETVENKVKSGVAKAEAKVLETTKNIWNGIKGLFKKADDYVNS